LTLVYETDPQALPLKKKCYFDALVRNVTIQAAACFNRIVSETVPVALIIISHPDREIAYFLPLSSVLLSWSFPGPKS